MDFLIYSNYIEDLIRQGSGRLARRELQRARKTKVPRPHVRRLAELARRAALPDLALRLLNPIVRPSAKHVVQASTEEQAEYAAALIRAGAPQEGLEILNRLPADRLPSIYLFQSFSLIGQWRYAEVIPLLKRYLASAELTPYQRLVGLINLVPAYLFEEKTDEAEGMLEELREQTQAKGLGLLRGNALELSAQWAIEKKQWGRANRYLDEALTTLVAAGTLDVLFVRKWRAIAEVLRAPSAGRKRVLHDVRREAFSLSHWETVRECDFYGAIAFRDERLATHLYFGTPHEPYRARVLKEIGRLRIPDSYAWDLPGVGPSSRRPRTLDRASILTEGQTLHRLLAALTKDFYRPQRIASLHADLFPREFFNPLSSPTRVHQLVRRLRRWMLDDKTTLTVKEMEGSYSLAATSPCRLVVTRDGTFSRERSWDDRLRAKSRAREFSASQAARWIESSERTASRYLLEATRQGRLVRVGKSSATRYRFSEAVDEE